MYNIIPLILILIVLNLGVYIRTKILLYSRKKIIISLIIANIIFFLVFLAKR